MRERWWPRREYCVEVVTIGRGRWCRRPNLTLREPKGRRTYSSDEDAEVEQAELLRYLSIHLLLELQILPARLELVLPDVLGVGHTAPRRIRGQRPCRPPRCIMLPANISVGALESAREERSTHKAPRPSKAAPSQTQTHPSERLRKLPSVTAQPLIFKQLIGTVEERAQGGN